MASDFLSKLTELLSQHGSMTTQEIYSSFSEMNQKTVSWHIHKALVRGNVKQDSHGRYSLPVSNISDSQKIEKLPALSRIAFNILTDNNFDFYLSGLDALQGMGFEVSNSYPVIICAKENQVKDVQLTLMRESGFAITEDEIELLSNANVKNRIQYVILKTRNMNLSKNRFAIAEKAFTDIYYAVTRLDYPLYIGELPHILKLIKPNAYRFRMSTKDRHLSDELNFLLNYNKLFIRELVKFI